MKEKIRQVEELQIAEQELEKTTIKRKNCSKPGEQMRYQSSDGKH